MYFILIPLLLALVAALSWKLSCKIFNGWSCELDRKFATGLTTVLSLMFIIPLSTGILGGWEESDGEAIGRVVDVSNSGVMFETTEVWIMYGDDKDSQTSAIRVQCSHPNGDMAEQWRRFIGKDVKIKYTGWHAAPWSLGDSSNIIKSIELNQ